MKGIYQKIFDQAKPYLSTRKNLIHTKIALRYALKLLEEEKGDEEIVIPAILLHDVGWKVIPEKLQQGAFGPNESKPEIKRLHEREGVKIARSILEGLHYPNKKIKEICRIIQGHDSRKKPISQNDRIVKDSDKLFRYSRKGMAIDLSRFQIPTPVYISYLEKRAKEWFFLNTSQRLAIEEIRKRKRETERGKRTSMVDKNTLPT